MEEIPAFERIFLEIFDHIHLEEWTLKFARFMIEVLMTGISTFKFTYLGHIE